MNMMKIPITLVAAFAIAVVARADYKFSAVTNETTGAKVTSVLVPDGSPVATSQLVERVVTDSIDNVVYVTDSCELMVQGFNYFNPTLQRPLSFVTSLTDDPGTSLPYVFCDTMHTQGNRVRVESIVDAIYKTSGKISTNADEVYFAGGTFLLNPDAPDEGVWLEDEYGEGKCWGTVTSSTATYLDLTPEWMPTPGQYTVVVTTRGGLGKGYSLSRASMTITISDEE